MDSDVQSRKRHKGGWKHTPSCRITGIVVSFPFMTTCASATSRIPFLGNQLERVLLPASTAAVEWLFSVKGYEMTDKRSRLQPTTIRNAMLLRMNTILARKDKLYEDINEYTKEKTRVATKQSLFICFKPIQYYCSAIGKPSHSMGKEWLVLERQKDPTLVSWNSSQFLESSCGY